MDPNVNQIFGGQAPQSALEEAWHQEQRRKSFDIIRVKNITTATLFGITYELPVKDFYIMYDTNQYQKIPAGSTFDLTYSRAKLFVEHKKDEIVNFIVKKMHDEFLEERSRKGMPSYTDKYVENKETYETQSYPKTNDLAVIEELYGQLWVGLVLSAGRDLPPPELLDPRSGEIDMKSNSAKVLEKLATKKVPESQLSPQDSTIRQTPPPIPMMPPPPPAPPAINAFAQMNDQLSAADVTAE